MVVIKNIRCIKKELQGSIDPAKYITIVEFDFGRSYVRL